MVYVSELYGGTGGSAAAQWNSEEGPTFRYQFELRYSYGRRTNRVLLGDLIGNAKRSFYRFEPRGGEPTPLY